MKLHKFLRILFALVLCVGLFPSMAATAMAQEQIDLNRSVSVTVFYREQDVGIPGAVFSIYKAGTVTEDGNVSLTGAFQNYPVSLNVANATEKKALAQTLAGYVLRDGIQADQSGTTDDNGVAVLDGGLFPGVYLILGADHSAGGKTYSAEPVLLTLPNDGGEGLEYDVSIAPKSEWTDQSGELTVVKIWSDTGFESSRPSQIKVELIDGTDRKLYGTAALSSKNGWRCTWDSLPAGHSWYVVERVPQGYLVTSQRDGDTVALTNTCIKVTPSEPEDSGKLPQTGMLQWPIPVLAVSGMILFLTGWLWRRRDEQA